MNRFLLEHRPRLLALGLGALVIIGIILVRGVLHRAAAANSAAEARAVSVLTTRVTAEDVPIYLDGIGTVQAAQSVTIKARVDGQLERVAFSEGQDVRQGALLAQIDPRPYQALLEQALAQKAHDQAQLANARRDLERYTMLFQQDSIQEQTLQTQKATVEQLVASVLADQAQVDSAQVQLSYTTIRAPLSGRAGVRLVDAGNIVHAADSTGLVVINQIDPIALVFSLPEDRVQEINRAIRGSGNALSVEARAREDDTLLATGRLLLVNNQIDTTTGTVQLKALFGNDKHTLWPGQYVNVRLVVGVRAHAITVPAAVIQRGPDGFYAYAVAADGKAVLRPLKVTKVQDGKAIIEQGLEAGARVVLDGQYKIKPGMLVEEAKAAVPPAGTPART
jgi:multidrug efflux system membrane fusion protein